MYSSLKSLFLTCVLVSIAAGASAQNRAFDRPAARTSQPGSGALTAPNASPRAALAEYLRAQGRPQTTADSLVEGTRNAARQGVVHVQFTQRAGGLEVFGTYAKAAFSARGELVNVIENLVDVPARVAPAQVNAQQAIAAAIANLYPALRTVPAGFFRTAPTATRVAIPHDDGSMTAGFLVETWTQQGNQLNESLVDRDGVVVHVELRTNNDSYNVFRVNPNVTSQAILPGAAVGSTASPSGWLFAGAQGATHISGNNANAYLDAVANNRSDTEGTAVGDGNFGTFADLTVSPSTTVNRQVAVQNLFYLNNLIHDILYDHGFTEAALNFQEDNFGRGGRGSDSVNAEAQDGGSTDNADFATPRDGSNPRMQMYLWTGVGTHQVLAGGFTFLAQGAEFGPALNTTGVTSTIQPVNDGVAAADGGTLTDACEALPAGSMAGAIALMDRGFCDFTVKVKNAQLAGAIAAIVANNRDQDSVLTMGGSDASISIPAVFVSQNSGNTLRSLVPISGTVRLAPTPPLQRDGDIDADIVFHEYCHGLTWRMIGSMKGPLAGAIGEGMSDVCAMLLTVDDDPLNADAIGEYSFSDAHGIRRQRYAGYNLITYGDIVGTEVHADGELYGAIGWRMIELFGAARRSDLIDYLVDGMNYTPATPKFENMRDGILQSIANTPSAVAGDDCLVWRAFAHYGVGVGASAVVKGKSVKVTESFTLPAACQP
jgi:extracellular elastinolytic metalloproteinase